MRPSSVGGGRNMRRTLSVCLSVRPSRARMYFVYVTCDVRYVTRTEIADKIIYIKQID